VIKLNFEFLQAHPEEIEEPLLANIKQWIMEDIPSVSNGRSIGASSNTMDREMLRTYATGLLAVALQT
jgi:hypothetical protein